MTHFRPADEADVEALRDLERAANLVALAHVFPPDDFPYPDQAVADRWRSTLADPAVRVEVVDGPRGLRVFVAYDATTLRHLAVHPDDWGSGLARAAIARATAAIAAAGEPRALLWCLAENHRALAVYRHLGWRPTGREGRAEWPPHPVELQLSLPLGSS